MYIISKLVFSIWKVNHFLGTYLPFLIFNTTRWAKSAIKRLVPSDAIYQSFVGMRAFRLDLYTTQNGVENTFSAYAFNAVYHLSGK